MQIVRFFILLAVMLLVGCSKQTTIDNTNPENVIVDPEAPLHATGYMKTHKGHGLIGGGLFKNPRGNAYLPVSFDWRNLGFELPVKDQGACGSCWAFSTVASLESAALIFNNKTAVASEQEIVDCDDAWYGCRGGNFAGPYLVKNGVTSEDLYPYEAVTQRCHSKGKERLLQPVSWYNLGDENRSPTVEELKAAIMEFGYVSVVVGANSRWDNYKGGVMKGCGYKGLNHMVNIVGWTEEGNWIMRNSWSKSWGDDGYALMPFGCDRIAEEAAYVIVDTKQ